MPENNLTITVWYSDRCSDPKNCLYPHEGASADTKALKRFFSFDHVFTQFSENRRHTDNFICANTAPFDCDNNHTDDPAGWIWPENIPGLLPGVRCVTYTSRHNMKPKGDRSARPRFHVIFGIEPVESPEEYTAFMKKVQGMYPFFDINALDAARFFFGNPDAEVRSFPGNKTLTQFIAESEEAFSNLGEVIPEGRRNSTLSLAAGKILKRLGDTPEAYEAFTELADKCSPPMEADELDRIWHSAQGFYHKKVCVQPGYIPPEEYNGTAQWEVPIPFAQPKLPPFPVDALPKTIGDYAIALAESTQTPVDMAATTSLPVMSVCTQGKYKIQAKDDWVEPTNTFAIVVMEPSERKSAVENGMTRPINRHEYEVNRQNAAAIESSKMRKRILERRQKALEDQSAKGKDVQSELEQIAVEIAEYREKKPLRLYVDDVTTEKLTSVLADNDGRAAILSTEGGIFDTLAGIYTKNVNIDVLLKGYSGDCIKVDRIGRGSESIMDPTLTILLMAQPSVLSGLMKNSTFRGRGLTARFLYCIPKSYVGQRKYWSTPVPDEIYQAYENTIRNMLEEEYPKTPEIITLSQEAAELIGQFAEELEPKLRQEYAEISDWAGKLVGNTHRIAGLLCRASVLRSPAFLGDPEPLVIDAKTMANAIRIARYFIEHAKAAFSLMGADTTVKQSQMVLSAIQAAGLVEFSRRDIMRLCRSFKRADDVQPVLDLLTDYGYIAVKEASPYSGKGRPPAQTYLVNPYVYAENATS